MTGIIDIGSNTIKASLYDSRAEKPELLFITKDTAGLAGYVESGALSPAGTEKLIAVLSAFYPMLQRLGATAVYLFATASLRNICNTAEVLAAVKARLGIDIRVLSGEEEAYLSFTGMMGGLQLSDGLSLDIGGGSTELLFVRGGKPGKGYSMPLGALKLYKRYCADILPTPAELAAMRAAADAGLDALNSPELLRGERADTLVGIGGSIRAACTLRARLFGGENRPSFTAAELGALHRRFLEDRRGFTDALLKVAPERVHTMLPGLVLLSAVTARVGASQILFSAGGVRDGFLGQLLSV